ncbi:hypothetical protein [African swine fever virus]|uniref:Uncharacterized protein n=1 Tax=African swine fever virus TaxID=10497 RepID=A0A3G1EUX4_ASF|nr:hypothetical protein F8221_gp052 [African swine fever virus]AOO54357.1 hypothetical protein AFSV47Ss_0052 [African swine fever virus]QIM06693.1 hypothetical protein [African swine fever virus]QIM06928.1 hypothetical protein [African swine fever virus]QIM07163.1 hypothetical protein [African swine fever virus]QIM07398.1 hypothetical protein [African swine fever virus]
MGGCIVFDIKCCQFKNFFRFQRITLVNGVNDIYQELSSTFIFYGTHYLLKIPDSFRGIFPNIFRNTLDQHIPLFPHSYFNEFFWADGEVLHKFFHLKVCRIFDISCQSSIQQVFLFF